MIRVLLLSLLHCVYLEAVTVPSIKLNDGNNIPCFGLGTALGNNTQGRIAPGVDEVESAVSWAIDAGYRLVDTAYHYGTEQQIGRALKKKIHAGLKREEIFVTTKLWNYHHAKEAVIPALRKSLTNLGLEYVDLYLIHWPVGQFVNLNLQQPELLSYCKSKNITVMGYTPFGSLLYSKAKEDAPPPRIDDPLLVQIAGKYNKTVPQIVLGYLEDLHVIPIPKSLTRSRIEENINIFDFQLTDEDRTALKAYDRGYRTIPQYKWKEHPYYPFKL